MNTAIVYLDIDDEITSAVSRIRALKAERIALTLPHGSRLATSRINFRLLAREAANRKKTLEIVTGDASARALAASAGLPTYVSVAAFEAGPVVSASEDPADAPIPANGGALRTGRHRGSELRGRAVEASPTIGFTTETLLSSPRTGGPIPQAGRRGSSPTRGRRLALVLGLVAILIAGAAAGFQLLPSATIALVPGTNTIGPMSLNVTAQVGITQPDAVGLVVPATTFPFDVEVSQTFPATGISVVETTATGEVTFSSLNTGGSNPIAEGSIVKTESGNEFRTTGPVTLPPAQIGIIDGKFVVIPSTRKVGVKAVNAGTSGNVAAGKIVVVPEKENPKRTLVNNEAPTTGGTRTENPVIQQSDVDAALRVLDTALIDRFTEQVTGATDVPEGTTLFPETRSLGPSTPTVDPSTLLALPQAEFDLGLTAQGTALGVNPGPVATLAEARIRAAVDAGFQLDEGSIDPTLGVPIIIGNTITFPVTVRATETRIVDATALRDRIRGLGLPQARTVLGAFGQVTISVWPDWVTTIPSNDSRVSFEVTEPVGSSAPSATPPAASGGPSSSGVAP
ncbi:MAG: baseplate J/gp47 family protein [Chloroflexota bacterium]